MKYNQDFLAAIELVNCCMSPAHSLEFFGLELLGEKLVAALGVPKFGSTDYLWHVGKKEYNLERCFNIREGFRWGHDTLPKRVLTEPLQVGLRDGEVVRKPDTLLKETLARLGLGEIDKDIAGFRG